MDFFWSNIFEYFKERRYASVFFSSLAISITLLALAAMSYQAIDGSHLLEYWTYMLPGIGLIFVALIGWVFLRIRASRSNRYKSSPLSRDEIIKARSKLKTK